jgi:hypothetical protein
VDDDGCAVIRIRAGFLHQIVDMDPRRANAGSARLLSKRQHDCEPGELS